MGKRRGSGARYRIECCVCHAKLEASREAHALLGRVVGGDLVVLVCNEKCEKNLYRNARIMNWLTKGEAVAYHSDAVIRHDLAIKAGKVGIHDGKIVYIDSIDELLPPE